MSLDERPVSIFVASQAKEHDIYDTTPFLRSKLFAANGYKLKEGTIEKTFKRGDEV